MNKPKLNQPDVEQSTTTPNVAYGTPESHYFHNPTSLPIPLDPTIEEVKKEWEDDDYIWEEDEFDIKLITKKPTYYLKIRIFKNSKTYQGIINFKEHIRLIKTFRALGWEV